MTLPFTGERFSPIYYVRTTWKAENPDVVQHLSRLNFTFPLMIRKPVPPQLTESDSDGTPPLPSNYGDPRFFRFDKKKWMHYCFGPTDSTAKGYIQLGGRIHQSHFGKHLGVLLGACGAIMGHIGGVLEVSCKFLEAPRGCLGGSWRSLGGSWGGGVASGRPLEGSGQHLGALLGGLGSFLG